MPAVVTLGKYDMYEKERDAKKQMAKPSKAERKRKRIEDVSLLGVGEYESTENSDDFIKIKLRH